MPEDPITGSEGEQVDSLIEQLRNTRELMNSPLPPLPELKKENAEDFVVQKASELVIESLDLVRHLKSQTAAAADAEGIEALAKLVSATSTALEALNKIVVQDKKLKGAKEIKKIEIEAKQEEKPDLNSQLTVTGTREEIFKLVLKEAEIIDIPGEKEVIDVEQTKDQPSSLETESAAPYSSTDQPEQSIPQ